jgi:hypothetical protein
MSVGTEATGASANNAEAEPDFKPEQPGVTYSSKGIYRSQNGDTWRLVRDAVSGQVFARHEANLSSGGHVTEIRVAEFLRQAGSGPEYAATRKPLESSAGAPERSGWPPKPGKALRLPAAFSSTQVGGVIAGVLSPYGATDPRATIRPACCHRWPNDKGMRLDGGGGSISAPITGPRV